MRQPTYDPLAIVPSPHVIRERLGETTSLARRLRILLRLSERIHATEPVRQSRRPQVSPRAEAAHA